MKKTLVRMPKDFVKPGAVRQCAWCWDDQTEFAYFREGRYDVDALEALSVWAADAAAYMRQGITEAELVKRERAAKLK